jgi:tetratricopeptide (TPR) repeat protein
MKICKILFLSVVIFVGCSQKVCLAYEGDQAVKNQKLFETANRLYKKGNFRAAIKIYKKIPNKSAYVNYNIGNCEYKLEKYGNALLYWRRAEKKWGIFNREELLNNIFLLKKKMGTVRRFRTRLANNIVISSLRFMPIITIQTLFLILWLFLFIYIRFLYKKKKKWVILLLFALIALFGILLAIRYSIDSRRYGVVVTKYAELKSGPGKTFQTLMNLPQTEEVIIKKESDGFLKIKVLRNIGWASKESVGEI